MAGFDINWGLAQPVNVGGAFQQGWQTGQAMRQETDTRNALVAYAQNPSMETANALLPHDPRIGMQMVGQQRELERTAQTGNLVAEAMSQPSMPASGAPETLVDPGELPQRTDGVRINHDALRRLYAHDPATALQVQKSLYDADAASFKRAQEGGKVLAAAAWQLAQVPPDQRAARLQAMLPQLSSVGIAPEILNNVDLSDNGLAGYQALGQDLGALIDDARAERGMEANLQNIEADNLRADRAAARADEASARSGVRFAERGKGKGGRSGGGGGKQSASQGEYIMHNGKLYRRRAK